MNSLMLYGTMLDEPRVHHEKYGCKMLTFSLSVLRQSESEDIINVIVSDKLIFGEIKVGDTVEVSGEIRNYNSLEHGKTNSKIFAYAYSVEKSDKNLDCTKNNTINIEGTVCNKPDGRTTNTGRKISTVLVAVKRKHNKVSYIPSICWGINSIYADHLKKEDTVRITGRLQSRKGKEKTYYEVSVQNITKI